MDGSVFTVEQNCLAYFKRQPASMFHFNFNGRRANTRRVVERESHWLLLILPAP